MRLRSSGTDGRGTLCAMQADGIVRIQRRCLEPTGPRHADSRARSHLARRVRLWQGGSRFGAPDENPTVRLPYTGPAHRTNMLITDDGVLLDPRQFAITTQETSQGWRLDALPIAPGGHGYAVRVGMTEAQARDLHALIAEKVTRNELVNLIRTPR